MANSLFTDNATQAAKLALNGLSSRQQVISRNIANVDTPGYQAQKIDFESTLKRVFNRTETTLDLEKTQSGHLAAPAAAEVGFRIANRAGGSLRADENNVDIDTELLEMSEAGIQYQAVAETLAKKLQLLKTIATR